MADRTVSVRLRAEAGQYMATMRAAGNATNDLEKANRKLSTALDREEDAAGKLRVALERMIQLEKDGKRGTLEYAKAREHLATVERRYAAAQDDSRRATEEWTSAQKRFQDENKKTGDSLRDVERIAKRTQIGFKALMTALAVGAPAASAAALGVAVAGAGAAFIGMGALALKNNAAVRQSFVDLAYEVREGVTADALTMKDEFVDAADTIGDRYQALRPQMRAAFEGAADLVDPLVDGVMDLAENALPGMVNAIGRAGPAVDGLGELMAKTGSGLSELFQAAADNSEAAGEGLSHLGDLIQGTLGNTGTLLGHLTQLWAEHGGEVSDVIVRIIGVLADLTGSALPLLSATAGSALQVLSGLLGAIEPMVPILGPAVAGWLALAGAMKAIGGVQSILGRVSGQVGGFVGGLREAEGRARAFKVVGAGLALGFAAMAAQSARLDISADGLKNSLSELNKTGEVTGALAGSMGSDLAQLKQAFVSASDNGFTGFLAKTAEAIPIVGSALQGMDDSVAKSEERMKSLDEALASLARESPQQAQQAFNQLTQQMGLSREETAAFRAELPQFGAAMDAAAQKQEKLGTSAMQSTPGIKELEESLATLADQTADTADRTDALNDAWRRLFGISLDMEEATAAFEGGLDDIRESLDAAKGASAGWRGELIKADGSINVTTETGRQLSEQLIQQGEDYRALAVSAYDSARKQGKSQEEATAAAVAAVDKRRSQFISEMVQMGLTEDQARKLANRYLGMPDDVKTFIRQPGMAAALANASSFIARLNRIDGRVVTVTTNHNVVTHYSSTGSRIGTQNSAGEWYQGNGGMADGGLVRPTMRMRLSSVPRRASGGGFQMFPRGMLSGPGGMRDDAILAFLSNREFVSTGESTQRNLDALEAGNKGARLIALGPGATRVPGFADGTAVRRIPALTSSAHAASAVNIEIHAPNYVGSVTDLMRTIRKEINGKGGNVQKVLGG